jgi:Flp pilus assembly protein TadG
MTPPRGQALVEFALILPLLLLLILGGLQVGLALLTRMELVHAATEGAYAGASEPSQPRRCDTALEVLAEVYGRALDDAACVPAVGQYLELRASVDVPLFIPGPDHWTITVTERAVIR